MKLCFLASVSSVCVIALKFRHLKALSKIVADNILNFHYYFSERIRLGISCESSASQVIHMKCQALFSQKNKNKTKMSSTAVVLSILRAKHKIFLLHSNHCHAE